MRRWQLQEAKARLSKLVKAAVARGPQEITVRGESAAVVISKADYDRLSKPKPSFMEFLRMSPLFGAKLEIDRDRSPVRDVTL